MAWLLSRKLAAGFIFPIIFLGSSLCLAFPSSEDKIGQKQHQEMLNKSALYDEPKLNAYIDNIGQNLVANSSMAKEKFQFFIIDSHEINAFAAPGGYVYITRGLLAHLSNEAQLAGVLAHEVAHITERHHARQKRAASGAKVLTVLTGVLTGSGEVAEAASLYSLAAVKGYGRDMELEADGTGAEILSATGYPGPAMLEVIGTLKDHETYQRRRARAAGKKTSGSYHGVFSSHPRNDKRLRQLVKAADSSNGRGKTNTQEFRSQINGLIYGPNFTKQTVGAIIPKNKTEKDKKTAVVKEKRYRHNSLGFSFAYNPTWQVKQNRSDVSVSNGKEQWLKIGLARHNKISAEQLLRKQFNIGLLKQSEPLFQNGLSGHTGIIDNKDKKQQQRVAVLYKGSIAFILGSNWQANKTFADADKEYNRILRSFRPERRVRSSVKRRSKTLHFVKANASTRFAALAKKARLGRDGIDQLRLINGYYPSGEPRPGDIIKIVY